MMPANQAIKKFRPAALRLAGELQKETENADAMLASLLLWVGFGPERESRQAEAALDGIVDAVREREVENAGD